MKSSKFVQGVLILTIAGVASKVLGALHRIPLTNILGSEGIGYYQMVFPIFAFLLTLTTGGVSVAVAREMGSARAQGNAIKMKQIASSNMLIMLVQGVLFSFLLASLARPIAAMQGNAGMAPLYYFVAGALLLSCLGGGWKHVFVGLEQMKIPALSQAIGPLFKLLFGLLFAYLWMQKGLMLGVMGAMLGVVLGEGMACLCLGIGFAKHRGIFAKQKLTLFSKNTAHNAVKLFGLSLPITLSLLALPLTSAVESLFVVNMLSFAGFLPRTATAVFGIWSGVVCSLVALPGVLALSVSTALVPSVGFETENAKTPFATQKASKSLGVVYLFSLLCAAGLYVLAPQVLALLYGTGLDFGGGGGGVQLSVQLLRVSAVNVVLLSLLQTTSSVLHALRLAHKVAIHVGFGALAKILCVLILVRLPYVHIWGSVIGNILLFAIPLVLNLCELVRNSKQMISIRVALLGVGSAVACGLVGFWGNNATQNLPIWQQFVVVAFMMTCTYLLLILLWKKRTKQKVAY